jgi:hypothetical protein
MRANQNRLTASPYSGTSYILCGRGIELPTGGSWAPACQGPPTPNMSDIPVGVLTAHRLKSHGRHLVPSQGRAVVTISERAIVCKLRPNLPQSRWEMSRRDARARQLNRSFSALPSCSALALCSHPGSDSHAVRLRSWKKDVFLVFCADLYHISPTPCTALSDFEEYGSG